MSTTAATENSGPGYAKHPEHTITIKPTTQRVRAVLNGETIADTTRALVMQEGTYAPCYYVPRADVRENLITPTATDSYCPFKGIASYWTFSVEEKVAVDAAWSYQNPYDEVMEIKGHLAFYPDRVDELAIDGAA